MQTERLQVLRVANLKIEPRHWVIAIGESTKEIFKEKGVEPTWDNLEKFISTLTPREWDRLNLIAKSFIESEYQTDFLKARVSGFDKIHARSAVCRVWREKYSRLEYDCDRNYSFLDPLIFRRHN